MNASESLLFCLYLNFYLSKQWLTFKAWYSTLFRSRTLVVSRAERHHSNRQSWNQRSCVAQAKPNVSPKTKPRSLPPKEALRLASLCRSKTAITAITATTANIRRKSNRFPSNFQQAPGRIARSGAQPFQLFVFLLRIDNLNRCIFIFI